MNEDFQRELYIFGEPLETELGKVRFLTYKEYLVNMQSVMLMSMNVLHIYYQLKKSFEANGMEEDGTLEQVKEESLYNIVAQLDEFKSAYEKIFNLVLEDEDMVLSILENEDYFMQYRKLVLDMQVTIEDEVSPNPEIQKGIEMSKKVKQGSAEKQTFTDIISSIVAGTGNSFKDVCDMTVYQVYAVFYRLGAIKNYDTETLFATVSQDVKISSWSKNIDLFSSEGSSIKRDEFDKSYGSLLK